MSLCPAAAELRRFAYCHMRASTAPGSLWHNRPSASRVIPALLCPLPHQLRRDRADEQL